MSKNRFLGMIVVTVAIVGGYVLWRGLPSDRLTMGELPASSQLAQVAQGCTGTAPSIRLLSPQGGETFRVGNQMNIKWATCNIPKQTPIIILLADTRTLPHSQSTGPYGYNTTSGVIVSNIQNTGSYTWTVPHHLEDANQNTVSNGWLNGKTYFIQIWAGTPTTPSAWLSESPLFSIQNEPACNFSVVTSPGQQTNNAPRGSVFIMPLSDPRMYVNVGNDKCGVNVSSLSMKVVKTPAGAWSVPDLENIDIYSATTYTPNINNTSPSIGHVNTLGSTSVTIPLSAQQPIPQSQNISGYAQTGAIGGGRQFYVYAKIPASAHVGDKYQIVITDVGATMISNGAPVVRHNQNLSFPGRGSVIVTVQ